MPEHIDHPSLSKIPIVDEKACRTCHRCLARETCRSKALRVLDPGEPPWVDGTRCYGCLACMVACPFGAIRV